MMAKAQPKTDCIHEFNPYAGFVGSHNGRCAAGATSKLPHSAPTHHVRVNGWCGEVCSPCATQYSKRKDAAVRPMALHKLSDAQCAASAGLVPRPLSGAVDIFAEDDQK
jgi:hypothetical protein